MKKVKKVKGISKEFGNHRILLNLKGGDVVLKVGSSLPKPGGKIKDDFCKVSLPLEALKEFDMGDDFSEAKIVHVFIINELVVPKEYENNIEKARIHAKRKGFLIRKEIIDGKEEEKKVELNV